MRTKRAFDRPAKSRRRPRMSNIHWLAVLSSPHFSGSASGSASALWLALALPAAQVGLPVLRLQGRARISALPCPFQSISSAPVAKLRGAAPGRTSLRRVAAAHTGSPRFLLLHSVQETMVLNPPDLGDENHKLSQMIPGYTSSMLYSMALFGRRFLQYALWLPRPPTIESRSYCHAAVCHNCSSQYIRAIIVQ